MLFFAVGVPFALLTAFVAADTYVDLSDLHGRSTDASGLPIVGWTALSSARTTETIPADDTRVGMAGYMMAPYQSGTAGSLSVKAFTLMPDAGLIIHPAHRDPDQMVYVWLGPKSDTTFRNRTLVFVTGHFEKTNALSSSQPLYALRNAKVRNASPTDLRSWFQLE